jgi:dihydroneopterin aldolase
MGIISLEKMEFFAHHGCFEEEQITGTYFEVDVQVATGLEQAAATDNIDDTLNYQWIYDTVQREMRQPSKLLEHVAGRILKALCTGNRSVSEAAVTVRKLNPPLGGKVGHAAVTVRTDNRQ